MPQTLVEIAELIDEPERLEVRDVTTVVERDPAVVAQLLNLANSSYYGLRRTVTTVERAVVLLGPVAVAGIVVGLNMLKLRASFDGACGGMIQQLTRHSLATAYLVRHLLEQAHERAGLPATHRSGSGGIGFTAGLLHDIGKIVLVRSFPDDAVQLYVRKAYNEQILAQDARELEQIVFGCSHAEAGEYAAHRFRFAPMLIDVIRYHHTPTQVTRPEHRRVALATTAANRLAKAMGYSFYDPDDWLSCAEDPFWDALAIEDPVLCPDAEALLLGVRQLDKPLAAYVAAMMMAADTKPTLPTKGSFSMKRAG